MATPERSVPTEESEREIKHTTEMTFFSLKDLEGDTNPLRGALIESYQKIFRGSPWFEYRECVDCGQSYSKEQYGNLFDKHTKECNCVICIKGKLEDPHESKKVWKRLQTELSYPDSFLLLSGTNLPKPTAANETVIVRPSSTEKPTPTVSGFTWGFSADLPKTMNYMMTNYFSETKESERGLLTKKVRKHLGNPSSVIYVSEFGIANDSRQTRLSFDMMQRLTNKILDDKNDPYLCWTSKGETRTHQQQLYGLSSPDKVIMAGKFSGLDAVFRTHYTENDPDKLRKVVRSIVTTINNTVAPEHQPKVKGGPPMYPMLLGLGAKPFSVSNNETL